ncbi:MAG TPA: hypothetical protein VN285_02135 [Candidatus Deferrimicrobium sp.]|nr:hypothetical protein [Candidatus Deferrimicrobium sp.]
MSEPVTVKKNRTLLSSQDYYFLREQGLEYIRSLSGKLWTDHNLHDPGITILEILCYALTDLGYRTGFETKDLLTPKPPEPPDPPEPNPPEKSGLFPAHEVMTTSPLTIQDYRRLLLKIEGVRNAWLDPMTDSEQVGNYRESEIPFDADCLASELTYSEVSDTRTDRERLKPRVRLSGLYRVLLELEIDEALGSLNESRLMFNVPRGPLKGVVLSLDIADPSIIQGDIDLDRDFTVTVTSDGDNFNAKVEVQLLDGSSVIVKNLMLNVINDRPKANEKPVPVPTDKLEAVVAEGTVDGIVALFWSKQQMRRRILAAVRCVLDAHRNLCEDFLDIQTVTAERIAICADVDLTGETDMEEVQARVFHAIEQYFNPPIQYFSLKELLDEGLCADDIFNGPYIDSALTCASEPDSVFTKPGFIKTENLEESELRRVIHVSDIINIVMDIEGVVSIRNVQLRKYNRDDIPAIDIQKWCLTVTPNHQPVLYIDRSKLLFFKDQIPYRAKPTEFRKTLDHLRAMARKAAYVEANEVLELPRGHYREPDRFYTIQHDFPLTYGIGEAGLPSTARQLQGDQDKPVEAYFKRAAQARQLKAYLTFYDQVLADYLAQLANVRRLFSLDDTLDRTYFSQYLTDITGVLEEKFEEEFYIDPVELRDEDKRILLTETKELYQNRRNRFLDHLAARFAEQFTDYVMMMFTLDGDPLRTGDTLIEYKIDFLREYPVVSRERNMGFNYRPVNPAGVWDTENVSGVEKRVSRLVGIKDYRRRDLACAEVFDKLFSTRADGAAFRVEIKHASTAVIFKSSELFSTREEALAEARKLYPFIRQESTYSVDSSGGTGQVFFTISAGGASLATRDRFETEADAVQNIREIIDRYDEILETSSLCSNEGFHLFEHILLRPLTLPPLTDHDGLMAVCLDPSCESCDDEDPYSFRITVVLPYWPERFRNTAFRRHFERTLRQETPAHIHARICWINNQQMTELEEKYRVWLEAKSANDADQAALTEASRELIQILQRLKTVFPSAVLHDCVEGGDETPVRLGSTNLGIF